MKPSIDSIKSRVESASEDSKNGIYARLLSALELLRLHKMRYLKSAYMRPEDAPQDPDNYPLTISLEAVMSAQCAWWHHQVQHGDAIDRYRDNAIAAWNLFRQAQEVHYLYNAWLGKPTGEYYDYQDVVTV